MGSGMTLPVPGHAAVFVRHLPCRRPGPVSTSGLASAGPGLPARVAAGPLERDDPALLEDLAAPDAARLAALDRAGQARPPQRARLAAGLGQLQVGRLIREPQLRVVAAWQWITQVSGSPGQSGQGIARHVASPP